MKLRNGFVSNSSSSSFIIGKYFMTPEQIDEFRTVCAELNIRAESWGGIYIGESTHYFDGSIPHGYEDIIISFMESNNISPEKYILEE